MAVLDTQQTATRIEAQILDTVGDAANAGSAPEQMARFGRHWPLVQDAGPAMPESGTAGSVLPPPPDHARALVRDIYAPHEATLRRQRSALAVRKLTSGLSEGDERALEYLSWQLDQIEDARSGEHLDALEHLVVENERLRESVAAVLSALRVRARPSKRKHRPRQP